MSAPRRRPAPVSPAAASLMVQHQVRDAIRRADNAAAERDRTIRRALAGRHARQVDVAAWLGITERQLRNRLRAAEAAEAAAAGELARSPELQQFRERVQAAEAADTDRP